MRLPHYDPDTAYSTNNLYLPRGAINEKILQATLTFQVGEEDEIEEGTNMRTGRRVPKYLRLWDANRNHIIVPRHFLHGQDLSAFNVVRAEPQYEEIDLPDTIVPRATQAKAMVHMQHHRMGTVNLACGKGKTVLALHYMVKRRRPGIVFVNQEALMEQWSNEIREFIGDIDIGIIQGKRWDWEGKPITIAMVQSVAQKPERWTRSFRERFGVVFYDEGHHMAAPMFNTTASLFFGDRFGLTATPYRGDGLENIYMYHLGPIIYQDLEQDLIPETYFHQTDLVVPKKDSSKIRDKGGQEHHGKLCSYLGSRKDRNEAILERIMEDWAAGRKMLVVSHSVDHIRELYEMMNRPEAGLITGSISDAESVVSKDRIEILLNCNPVFGTFQLTREGLNKKELDCLHICTSFSSSNDLQQSFGRIQRAKDGKPGPFVRIWEDPNIKMSRNQCNRLRTYLRALRYPFDFIQERL